MAQAISKHFQNSLICENCRSMAFATDCKDKGKNAVYFMDSEIAELLKDVDIVSRFIMYTDGPSSEFKNRCINHHEGTG